MEPKYVMYDEGNGEDVSDLRTKEEVTEFISAMTEEEKQEHRELDIYFVNVADEADIIEF